MVTFAPINKNDGPPPYSSGGIVSKPELPDWFVVKDEKTETPTGKEIEEKFWEFVSNNKDVQKILEQCKTGTLGAYNLLEEKIAELKKEFYANNQEVAQTETSTNNGFNSFKYGAVSQGGLVNLLT